MSRIAMTILVVEAILLGLTIPVAVVGSELSTGASWVVGGGLAVVAIVAAGLVRRGRIGYVLGSVVQLACIALGLWVPAMFILGGIFALLWFVLLRIGPEVERAQAARSHTDQQG